MRDIVASSGRFLALTVLYAIVFAGVTGALIRLPADPTAAAEPMPAFQALLIVSALTTAALSYIVLRSRWTGRKLTLALFFILYGVATVMPQIETAFFVTRLPAGLLPRLFMAGAIVAAIFTPIAVRVLGKSRPHTAHVDDRPLRMPVSAWAMKLTIIVVAYIAIYFTFGYYIAWQSEAVRAYYGGTDPGSFSAQLRAVVRETPWLVPLQVVRALLWAALAVPVIRMMRGRWWEAGLAVALLFAVVMNVQLLLPNPLMPRDVRMVHLVETASSNFLFGWLVVMVLRARTRHP